MKTVAELLAELRVRSARMFTVHRDQQRVLSQISDMLGPQVSFAEYAQGLQAENERLKEELSQTEIRLAVARYGWDQIRWLSPNALITQALTGPEPKVLADIKTEAYSTGIMVRDEAGGVLLHRVKTTVRFDRPSWPAFGSRPVRVVVTELEPPEATE